MSSITPSDKELEQLLTDHGINPLYDPNLSSRDIASIVGDIVALIASSNAKAVKAALERLYQQGDDFDVAIPAAIRVQDTIIKEASHE